MGSARAPNGRAPRWLIVLAIVAILVVVLFLIWHVTSGGFGGHTPMSIATGT